MGKKVKMKFKMKKDFDVDEEELYEQKIPIKFNIYTLNHLLAYVIADSTLITRGHLANVRKLFRMLDERIYESNYYLLARIKFIKRALQKKLDDFVDHPQLLLDACRTTKFADIEDEIIKSASECNLTPGIIKYLSSDISDKLSSAFVFKYSDDISDILDRFNSGDYESSKKMMKALKKQMSGLLNDIRKAESMESSDTVFTLNQDIFESVMSNTVKKLQNPSNQLKTGISYLNEITSGGFEAKRFYLFLGLSGGFKSGLLLNLLYHMKMYNQGYQPKDPSKKPAIMLVTQENSVEETVERLFSLAVCNSPDVSLKDFSAKDAIDKMKSTGHMTVNIDNNIDVIIVYKPGHSIDTSDIYSIIDDFEEDGYEIICLIHDYIKRLKSVHRTSELRLELGYIVDELKTLAIEKDIPVISASQLNRNSAKTIDEAIECNKSDLARLLGKSDVGESWSMIENSDFVCIINREEMVSEKQMYLTFKRIKIRYKEISDLSYFNQPFASNKMLIAPDVHLDKPLARLRLAGDVISIEEESIIGDKGRKSARQRETIATQSGPTTCNLSDVEDIIFGRSA